MQRGLRTEILSALFLSTLLNLACPLSKSGNSDMRPIGPQVKADLVIYFKTAVGGDEISTFSKEVLSQPDPKGRGEYLPPGVRTSLRIYPPVLGHEAIAITFFPNATDVQRRDLKEAIKASPIVYKVLENVAPADVKKID